MHRRLLPRPLSTLTAPAERFRKPFCTGLLVVAAGVSPASLVAAQDPTPGPSAPAAAAPVEQPVAPAQPAQAPAADATPPAASPAPASTPAQAPPEAATPAPAAATPAPAVETKPQPPTFFGDDAAAPAPREPLGGAPEPEIKEGEWDPWEHRNPGDHAHDGFFLRIAVGLGRVVVGSNDVVAPVGTEEITYQGLGLGLSIAIGGAIVDNLILDLDIFHASIVDPEIEVVGEDIQEEYDNVGVGGLGIGLTYYFMPINIYVSAALGLGQVNFEASDGQANSSDIGFVGDLVAGKEWWVAKDWGLGAALQLIFVSADDPVDGRLRGLATSLLFSATHN